MVARVTSPEFVRLHALPHGRRVLLRFTGADVRRFLQGVLSADVDAVLPGRAGPAALLTVKGKLVSEAIVLVGADGAVALAVPAEVADAVASLLERHIIMDDVVLARDDAAVFALVWPALAAGAPGVELYATSYPAPGTLVVGPEEALTPALAGCVERDPSAWDRLRISAGLPAWGREVVPDSFPPEVGFVAAVSYDKGCYMGQEPLARIHARGQVNRVMVRVRAETCPSGPVDLAAPERPAAGRWTTWAPEGEGALGLAIVHRSAARPGTLLQAPEVGAVEVISGPLGDDPGVAGKGKSAAVQLGRR